MEDPQALAGLLKGDESDDDFHYEEVEVMRYLLKYMKIFENLLTFSCHHYYAVRMRMTVQVKIWMLHYAV
jgi:hypothetical protein